MISFMTGKIRTLLATAVGGLALAGCEAVATDKKSPETSKFKNAETVKKAVAAKTLTLLDCLKMENQSEKSACKLEVKAQREAEIAKLNAQLLENAETIKVNNEAKKERELKKEELDKTYEVLIKEIAEKAAEVPNR